MRLAASRTFWMAGRSRPISTAMMAMTMSSSAIVKPGRVARSGMAITPAGRRAASSIQLNAGRSGLSSGPCGTSLDGGPAVEIPVRPGFLLHVELRGLDRHERLAGDQRADVAVQPATVAETH